MHMTTRYEVSHMTGTPTKFDIKVIFFCCSEALDLSDVEGFCTILSLCGIYGSSGQWSCQDSTYGMDELGEVQMQCGLRKWPRQLHQVWKWQQFYINTNLALRKYLSCSEKLFVDMADRMAAEGYREAGYEYVIIDDCWSSKERDENGRLQADPKRFPHGIKWLSDYVCTHKIVLLNLFKFQNHYK